VAEKVAAPDFMFISDPPSPPEGDVLDAYSRAVIFVAEKLSPSVANLRTSQRVRGGRVLEGAGSGVVITADGFMLTSAHVVARSDGGRASFADGRELDFELVGADPLSDLAVLRVADGSLVPAELGDAERLSVGQLAVGRLAEGLFGRWHSTQRRLGFPRSPGPGSHTAERDARLPHDAVGHIQGIPQPPPAPPIVIRQFMKFSCF